MRSASLLKGSFIVSVGTVAGGILSYLFSVSMGRMLGPAQFGDLGAISSLLAIFTSVSASILTVVMHYSAVLRAQGGVDQIRSLQKKVTRTLIAYSLVLAVVLAIFVPLSSRIFSISDTRAVYISLIAIVFGFVAVVNRGILQGCQQFLGVAVSTVLELLSKVLIAVVLVGAGWSLFGAAIAMVFSGLVASLSSHYLVKKVLDSSEGVGEKAETVSRGEVLSYLWPTVIATFLLLGIMNLDVILIKRYFEPDVAGQYVAISTIAKIIFYITGPISLVMFPIIAEHRSKGEKHYQVLVLSLIITALVSAVLYILYAVFQEKIVVALYGGKYGDLAHLLPAASWLVIFLSMVNLMVQYFMSIKQFSFIYFFIPVLFGSLWQIRNHHQSISGVLHNLQQATALLFLMLLVYYLITKRSQLAELFKSSYV